MSDLETALEPVRQILARRAAERSSGISESGAIKAMLDEASALLARVPSAPAAVPASANGQGSTNGHVALDRATFDQNLADVREIAKRLRSAGH